MITAPLVPVLPPLVDLIAVAVFALSGALLAARLNQTFVTAIFFALLTGVGGGSVRDILIGIPAFWLHNYWIAPIILVAAMVAWFTPGRWWEGKLFEWADALGLTAYAALGTAKALAFGVTPVAAAILGVVTGCVGGIIRDVVAGVPSILMRPELYVTAAALSAGMCALLVGLGASQVAALGLATLAGFMLRGASMIWQIELPTYSKNS